MSHVISEQTIEQFRQWLISEEKSQGTIDNYTRHLHRLAVFLEGREVTKESIIKWKRELEKNNYKARTVNSILISVNSYLKFAGLQEYCVKTLRIQKAMFREKSKVLTCDEYKELIAAAENRGQDRLALVIETICATGIRVSELQYITVETIAIGRAVIVLKGKIRTILIPRKLCKKLKNYAKKNKILTGEIFVTRNGKTLDRRQIWNEMKTLCHHVGINPEKVFPHNLRHLFATTFYCSCKDISRLADVLGHSSIETTRIYLVTSGEEHRRQLDKLGLVI